MVRPIIVVGMNRTGTKWLSNIICSHEDVIGVQSARAGGILETNMFSAMQDKFDLEYPDDYLGLVELWSRTEFFRLTGVPKEIFYARSPRPRNMLTLFELLMNEYARHNGKQYWLQKVAPPNAEPVLEYFGDARVVVARRNLPDTVRSMLGLQKRYGSQVVPFRATWRCVYQQKLLNRICRRYPAIEVRYEDLRQDPAREKARILAELGLDPGRASMGDRFRPNTSFAGATERRAILTPRGALAVRGMAAAIGLVPRPLFSAAIAARRCMRGKPRPLVEGTFGALGDGLADRSRGPRSRDAA